MHDDLPHNAATLGSLDSQIDAICDRFEDAWKQNGPPPDIGSCFRSREVPGDGHRRQLLVELVKIDIYHRWRNPPASGTVVWSDPTRRRRRPMSCPPARSLTTECAGVPLAGAGGVFAAGIDRRRDIGRGTIGGGNPAHREDQTRFPDRFAEIARHLADVDTHLGRSLDTDDRRQSELDTGDVPRHQPAETEPQGFPAPAVPAAASAWHRGRRPARYRPAAVDRPLSGGRSGGRGASGRVYRGFDRDLNRAVAIKADHPQCRMRFRESLLSNKQGLERRIGKDLVAALEETASGDNPDDYRRLAEVLSGVARTMMV